VPVIDAAISLCQAGHVTGASARNWAGIGTQVRLASTLPAHAQALLTDPQTSGGLLIACAPTEVGPVLETLRSQGFAQAAQIGHLQARSALSPAIEVV
jgi:selenide, water dikinase